MNTPLPSPKKRADYRPDIDGMRALAVLFVLAFHADPARVQGGFIGVDIFFVLSGYLISRLITSDLAGGRFSVGQFYARRIRRILPALIVVLAVTFLVGYRVLFPGEYRALGTQGFAGAALIGNIAAWRATGYFELDAARQPLLHLWTLGIEEQFYLFWPWLLWALRDRPRLSFWLIGALAALSFTANLVAVFLLHRESFAFYLPLTRVWELALGSLLATGWGARASAVPPMPPMPVVQPSPRGFQDMPSGTKNLVSVLGFSILVSAPFIVRSDLQYPGWAALAPVTGTLLVILGGPASWINRHILGSRPMVFIGLISYPLYLWHWPLLVFARLFRVDTPVLLVAVLACAVGLAILTTFAFENRIRQQLGPRLVSVLLITNGALAGLGLAIGSGALTRQPPAAAVPILAALGDRLFPRSDAFDGEGRLQRQNILTGDPEAITLYIGDSHLQQYWPRLAELAAQTQSRPHTIEFAAHAGCPPFPGVTRLDRSVACSAFVNQALALAADPRVKTVVFIAWWEWYVTARPGQSALPEPLILVDDPKRTVVTLDGPQADVLFRTFESTLASLTGEGKQVVIVLSNPTDEAFNPTRMLDRWTWQVRPARRVMLAAMRQQTDRMSERLRAVAARSGAIVIDPLAVQCDSMTCPTTSPLGRPLYSDSNHMRPFFASEQTYLDAFNY